MKNWLRMVMMAVMTSVLVACGSGDPGDVAEAFYKEVLDGDVNKAVDYLYLPAEVKQAMSESDMKGKMSAMFGVIQEAVQSQGGLESVKAGKVLYNDDKTRAVVEVMIKTKNGEAQTEKVPMIKTDDGWKLEMGR